MNTNRELFAQTSLVFTLVRGLYLHMEEDVKLHLKKYGIGFSSFRILWILNFNKEMTMSDLSQITQSDISNVYRQIIKLKDSNLVNIKSGEDARIKEISLTEQGQNLISNFINSKSTSPDFQVSSLLKQIPEADLDKFIQVVTILSNELIGPKFTEFVQKASNTIEQSK